MSGTPLCSKIWIKLFYNSTCHLMLLKNHGPIGGREKANQAKSPAEKCCVALLNVFLVLRCWDEYTLLFKILDECLYESGGKSQRDDKCKSQTWECGTNKMTGEKITLDGTKTYRVIRHSFSKSMPFLLMSIYIMSILFLPFLVFICA